MAIKNILLHAGWSHAHIEEILALDTKNYDPKTRIPKPRPDEHYTTVEKIDKAFVAIEHNTKKTDKATVAALLIVPILLVASIIISIMMIPSIISQGSNDEYYNTPVSNTLDKENTNIDTTGMTKIDQDKFTLYYPQSYKSFNLANLSQHSLVILSKDIVVNEKDKTNTIVLSNTSGDNYLLMKETDCRDFGSGLNNFNDNVKREVIAVKIIDTAFAHGCYIKTKTTNTNDRTVFFKEDKVLTLKSNPKDNKSFVLTMIYWDNTPKDELKLLDRTMKSLILK